MATAPTSLPSAVASSSTGSTNGSFKVEDVGVQMFDNCDSATFNAVLGDGTCARAGGMKFDHFLEILGQLGFVGPWHFSPSTANVRVGQRFVVFNTGGEEHTFTEVEEFGGGVIPLLNELAHLPNVAPECAALEDEDKVPAGGTYIEEISEPGTLKVQCCNHPWMRLEARVSAQ